LKEFTLKTGWWHQRVFEQLQIESPKLSGSQLQIRASRHASDHGRFSEVLCHHSSTLTADSFTKVAQRSSCEAGDPTVDLTALQRPALVVAAGSTKLSWSMKRENPAPVSWFPCQAVWNL